MPIEPHGGMLVNRIVEGNEKERLKSKIGGMAKIKLNPREVSDLEMISIGAFSPLEGFMVKEDYQNTLDFMRLAHGLPWTIPITLSVTKKESEWMREGEDVALLDQQGNVLGCLHLDEKYGFDKQREAEQVLRTVDGAHPGVKYLREMGDVLLGGKVSLIERPKHEASLSVIAWTPRRREYFLG